MPEKYTDTTMSDNFIRRYQMGSMLAYDGGTPFMSMLKKDFDLSGEDFRQRVDLSMGAGFGAGSLPEASVKKIDQMIITEKDMYARAKIERKAIYKAKNKGAFVDSLEDTVDTTVKGFSYYVESALMSGNVRGVIATGGVADSDPSYVLTISDATWNVANWEVGMLINVASGTDKFKVTAIDPANKAITAVRDGGSQTPAQGESIYVQGSKDNEITALSTVCDATSGSLYGIPVGYRWQAQQDAAGGEGITTERIDKVVDDIFDVTGQGPNLILTSTTQARKLRTQYEDLKRYIKLEPSNKKLRGVLGFQGLDYQGPTGPAPIVTSRFCPKDRVYVLNTNKMSLRHLRGGGWFTDDTGSGNLWLREQDSDSYEARFGFYMEFVAVPTFQGVITGLAT